MTAVNLARMLSTFTEHWQPRTVAQLNGHDADTDDVFLVLVGRVTIQLRDREVVLGPGELFVVPKGVEHRPTAEHEAHVLLIEPSGPLNTGDPTTAAARRVI